MKNRLIIGLLVLAFCSCDSFLKEYSQDLARVESVSDLDELLLGSAYHNWSRFYVQYSTLYSEGEPFNVYTHFMSDELKRNDMSQIYGEDNLLYGHFTWQRQVGLDVQNTSVYQEDGVWTMCYKYINATNMILAELENVNAGNDKEELQKIRIKGEAAFLRAFYYFTLVNLYAEPYASSTVSKPGVPLKLSSYIEDKDYTPATVEEVYEQILEDLDRAETCLKQTNRVSLYRADLTATYLLKSRVYLYMQDYKNTRKYAQYVLDRNNHLTDLNTFDGTDNVYTSASPEVIFSMGGDFLTNYMYDSDRDRYWDEYPYYLSDELVAAFDDNDLRKTKYMKRLDNTHYAYKKIYWGRAHYGTPCTVSDNVMFRATEAYLNLAEAAAFDNDEAKAREIIALLLEKRFANAPSVNESGNDLIDLIRAERRRELCLEGHRWYDLRRYCVCEKYPWSKPYRHTWAEVKYDYYSYDYIKVRERTYELEAFDKAYTLAYPKEVIEFQNTIGSNNRPDRLPVKEINNSTEN